MASKRTFDEEDNQGNDDTDLRIGAKRRQHLASLIAADLKPVFLNMFKEVLPSMLQGYSCPRCQSSLNQQGTNTTSGGRAMQLCFVNRLSKRIFTLAGLTAEDGGQLQIELRYAASQKRVVTEQISNMELQICVLHGHFRNEDWTAQEFDAEIVKPRKGSLLRGETVVRLNKGVASIDKKIMFGDNSSWTRSKKFRLGVKFLESNFHGLGAGIREGRSEPFRVLDSRGQSYMKEDHPSLNDKVWRLTNIAKGGRLHRQLSSNGIKTVKDLLRLNTIGSLREKFGNIKAWDIIIAHAKDCEFDDYEQYHYHYQATEQLISVSLVLNCIYQVVGVSFNGQHPRSPQSLNLEEQRLVEKVKQEAYKNLQDLVPNETQTHDIVKNSPDQGLLQQLCPAAQQGQLQTWLSTSTSIMDESANNNPLDWDQLQGEMPEETFFNIDDEIGNTQSQIGEFESYFNPNPWEPLNPCSITYDHGATSSYFLSSAVNTSRKGKVWQKTRNILKWIMPHVTKWRAKLFQYY